MANTEPAAKTPAGPPAWTVIDKNAFLAKRKHEIIIKTFTDGREPLTKTYELSADVGTPMPMDHALMFLTDRAFEVTDSDGDIMQPPPKADENNGAFELPPHQTIANWDELSKPALYKRCKVLPGSHDLKPTASAEAMVAFLQEHRKNAKRGAGMPDADVVARMNEGQLDGQLDAAATNALFGGDSPVLSRVAQ